MDNNRLKEILELSDDYAESRKDRRKGSGGSQEYFSPYSIVVKMCDKVPVEKWQDPESTWLEPSFGNGSFIVEIIRRRIQDYNIPWQKVLETLYGTELMADNVEETHDRVVDLLIALEVHDFKESLARKIMKENLVQTDFFKWDFENWKPLEENKANESVELF